MPAYVFDRSVDGTPLPNDGRPLNCAECGGSGVRQRVTYESRLVVGYVTNYYPSAESAKESLRAMGIMRFTIAAEPCPLCAKMAERCPPRE